MVGANDTVPVTSAGGTTAVQTPLVDLFQAPPFQEFFYVEAFREPSDPVGDDTLPIQRAINAAQNSAAVAGNVSQATVLFANKTYYTTGLTIGLSNDGLSTTPVNYACNLKGASWLNSPGITQDNLGGSRIILLNSVSSPATSPVLTIYGGGPQCVISDLLIDGGAAGSPPVTNASCHGIYLPQTTQIIGGTETALEERSARLDRVYIKNCYGNCLYIGLSRNNGEIMGCQFIKGQYPVVSEGDSMAPNWHVVVCAGAQDWRVVACDVGTSPGFGWYMDAGGDWYIVGSDAFGNGNGFATNAEVAGGGVFVSSYCGGFSYVGGSLDGNAGPGAVIVGNSKPYTGRALTGVQFNHNCTAYPGEFADICCVASMGLSVTGCYFFFDGGGTPDYYGPAYLLQTSGVSGTDSVVWAGNVYQPTLSPGCGYTNGIFSDPTVVIDDPSRSQIFKVVPNLNAAHQILAVDNPTPSGTDVVPEGLSLYFSNLGSSTSSVNAFLYPAYGGKIFNVGSSPAWALVDSTQSTDEKVTLLQNTGGQFFLSFASDNLASDATIMQVGRLTSPGYGVKYVSLGGKSNTGSPGAPALLQGALCDQSIIITDVTSSPFSATIQENCRTILLVSTTAGNSVALTLPSAPINGQELIIATNMSISLTLSPSASISGFTTGSVPQSSSLRYTFSSTVEKWFQT